MDPNNKHQDFDIGDPGDEQLEDRSGTINDPDPYLGELPPYDNPANDDYNWGHHDEDVD